MIIVITISCESSHKHEYIKKDGINGTIHNVKYESFLAKDSFGIIKEGKPVYGVGGTDNRHVFFENGHIKYTIKYWDGEKQDSSVFIRNEKENIDVTEKYRLDGQLFQKLIEKRNRKGKVESASIYNQSGDLTLKWVYTYPNDTLTKIKTIRANQNEEDEIQTTLLLNSFDQPIKETRFKGDKFLNAYEYEYYENGLKKSTIIKFKDNDVSVYRNEYKYDQNGSWIRKIISVDETPKYIVKRKLRYN
jgi:hypothetical protein